MTYTVSITKKGQMTLPKDIRDQLGVKAPGKVAIDLRPDGSIKLSKPLTLEQVRKILSKPAHSDPLTEREKLIGNYLAKKYDVRRHKHSA